MRSPRSATCTSPRETRRPTAAARPRAPPPTSTAACCSYTVRWTTTCTRRTPRSSPTSSRRCGAPSSSCSTRARGTASPSPRSSSTFTPCGSRSSRRRCSDRALPRLSPRRALCATRAGAHERDLRAYQRGDGRVGHVRAPAQLHLAHPLARSFELASGIRQLAAVGEPEADVVPCRHHHRELVRHLRPEAVPDHLPAHLDVLVRVRRDRRDEGADLVREVADVGRVPLEEAVDFIGHGSPHSPAARARSL